jgi:hypothetical protein
MFLEARAFQALTTAIRELTPTQSGHEADI